MRANPPKTQKGTKIMKDQRATYSIPIGHLILRSSICKKPSLRANDQPIQPSLSAIVPNAYA